MTYSAKIAGKNYKGSLAELSATYCALRDESGRGASRWPMSRIVGLDAYIAYNGRVFAGSPRDWTPTTALLFDNRQTEAA